MGTAVVFEQSDADHGASAIKPEYLELDEFTLNAVTVAEREALLVRGKMVTGLVSWADTVHGPTACPVAVGNQTATAALLIRNGDGAWASTDGMGFQLLDQDKVDPNLSGKHRGRWRGRYNSATSTTSLNQTQPH